MAATRKSTRTCFKGHRFQKISDCPTCPICEAERRPAAGFLSELSAPARRALESKGIVTIARLSEHTEDEILQLHGIGPSAIPKLKTALHRMGLSFLAQRQPIANDTLKRRPATRVRTQRERAAKTQAR